MVSKFGLYLAKNLTTNLRSLVQKVDESPSKTKFLISNKVIGEEPSESEKRSEVADLDNQKNYENESNDKYNLIDMKSIGAPSESSQSKAALRSLKSKKFRTAKVDQVMNMVNEVLNKANENRARIELLETNLNDKLSKEFEEFKVGMAQDMIALEKKINNNFDIYRKDTGKLKDRLSQKFKDFKKKIDENHDLVLKRFAKEKYADTKYSPRNSRKMIELNTDRDKLKNELHRTFSKERIDLNITSISNELEVMRDMMRRLSVLTSKEIDGLKEDFENFK